MGGILGSVLGIIGGGRAAGNISNANIAAEHGVLGATGALENDITQALYSPYMGMGLYQNATSQLNPYLASGAQGSTALQGYVANAPTFNPSATTELGNFALTNPQFNPSATGQLANFTANNPGFSFNPSQFFNSPAFQFEEQQGTNAITNAASAMGLGASGNTLRDIDKYTQGLAGTYYNQAFNQAQQTFGTNEQATLANLSQLFGQQQGTYETNAQTQLAQLNSLYGQQQGTFQTNQNATLQNLNALIQSGQFGASENARLANAASNFYLGGNEALGGAGVAGAGMAGGYAVNAGLATAAGNQNFYNNIGSLAAGAGGLLSGLPTLLAGL